MADTETDEFEDTDGASSERRGGVSFSTVLIINILVTVAILLATAYWWPTINQHLLVHIPHWRVPSAEQATSPDTTEVRLAQIEQTQKELESQLAALQESTASAEETGPSEIAMLVTRLEELEEMLDTFQPAERSAEILAFQQELLTAERNIQQQLAQIEQAGKMDFRLFIAFQELQSRALDGKEYGNILQKLIVLGTGNESLITALSALEPYAKTGRPTAQHLVKEFGQALHNALANRTAPDNASFSGKVAHNLSKFITVRRIDTEGNSLNAQLRRAEQAVDSLDFAVASQELSALPEEIRIHFQGWLQLAEAYQTVPPLLNAVEMQLADQLVTGSEAQ